MCPTARSRGDLRHEHVKIEKGCKIGLETPDVHICLRNEYFQNAARGPFKYVGPGPSAPHFENLNFSVMSMFKLKNDVNPASRLRRYV